MRGGRSSLSISSLLAFVTLGAAACGPPTFADVQREIFTPRCANAACHGGDTPQLDLDLSEGKAWSNIVNVDARAVDGAVRVVPGNPDESLLFQLLEGPVASVRRMPVGFPLEPHQIDMVRQWIEDGAPKE